MIHFGKKEEFSITVDYYAVTCKDESVFVEDKDHFLLGGRVYFWVKGKNLFEFKDCGPDVTYEFWDLTVLIEFFTSKLFYHIIKDPFPQKTRAIIATEKVNEVRLIPLPDNDLQKYAELDWDKIDMELRTKIDLWIYHHWIRSNSGGSGLPNLYICRPFDTIEISWKNDSPFRSANGDFYFSHEEGVEYIDLKLYRDTVIEFCLDFIERFKNDEPKLMKKYRKELQKAIDVVF